MVTHGNNIIVLRNVFAASFIFKNVCRLVEFDDMNFGCHRTFYVCTPSEISFFQLVLWGRGWEK